MNKKPTGTREWAVVNMEYWECRYLYRQRIGRLNKKNKSQKYWGRWV